MASNKKMVWIGLSFDKLGFVIGVIGMCLIGYGVYLYSKPLSYIVMGCMLLIWSFLIARSVAITKNKKAES